MRRCTDGPATCVRLTLAIGLLTAAFAAGADDTVRTTEPGVLRVDATLPGPAIAALVHRDSVGPAIWLLVVDPPPLPAGEAAPAAGEDPCAPPSAAAVSTSLWRFDPAAGAMELRSAGLPTGPGALQSIDVDGDGTDDLIGIFDGALLRLGTPDGTPTTLFADPDLHPRTSALVPPGPGGSPPPLLTLPAPGSVRFLAAKEGGFVPVGAIGLPVATSLRRNRFTLVTRPPLPIDPSLPGSPLVTPPEPLGNRRLRGTLVRPLEAPPATIEWWAGLPGPEEVIEHAYLTIGGEPALFVTTRPADKLSLFGEKRLRLYRLGEDRSRTGQAPFFAVETRANLWQSISPLLLDVNGDRSDDLLLVYWKGLLDARLVIDAYLADGQGSFSATPHTSGFDVRKGERSFAAFGRDVDGDGISDLLAIGEGRLQIFPGLAGAKGGRDLVATKPAWSVVMVEHAAGDEDVTVEIDVGDGGAIEVAGEPLTTRGPRYVDVDGDGRHEVLFAVPTATGSRVTWVRFGR